MPKQKTLPIFARNLSALLSERGISVRKAARLICVSPSTIVDWKSGVSPTDYEAVRRLAKALSVSMSYLLTGQEDYPTSNPPPMSAVLEFGPVVFEGLASIRIVSLIPKTNPESDLP